MFAELHGTIFPGPPAHSCHSSLGEGIASTLVRLTMVHDAPVMQGLTHLEVGDRSTGGQSAVAHRAYDRDAPGIAYWLVFIDK